MTDPLLNASLEILATRAQAHRARRERGLRTGMYQCGCGDTEARPPTSGEWIQAFADVLRQELYAGEHRGNVDELRARFDELREHALGREGLTLEEAAAIYAADWPAVVLRLGGRS